MTYKRYTSPIGAPTIWFLLLLGFVLFIPTSFAQKSAKQAKAEPQSKEFSPLWGSWSRIFPQAPGFNAKAATLLRDGRTLVVVGDQTNGPRKGFGVVYVLDRLKGELVSSTPRFSSASSTFNAVVQADDGNIYVAGAEYKGKRKSRAVLIQLDPISFKEESRDTTTDDAFTHIVWLNYGTGLVTAVDTEHPGSIRIYRIVGRSLRTVPEPIGHYIENVAALLPIPFTDSLAWVMGTTRKGEHRAGDAWLLKVNDRGNYSENPYFFGKKYEEQLTTAAVSLADGQLLMGGRACNGSDIYDPLFIKPYKEFQTKGGAESFTIESNESDYVSAISATGGHGFLFLNTTNDRERYTHCLMYTGSRIDGTLVDTIQGLNAFQAVATLRDSAKNMYYIVGNYKQDHSDNGGLCIVAIKEHYDKGKGKGKSAGLSPSQDGKYPITCQNVVFKELQDKQPDNTLSPHENAAIWFTLVNQTASNISGPLTVQVRNESMAAGVIIQDKIYEIGDIGAGEPRVVKIGLKAADIVPYNPRNSFQIVVLSGTEVLGICTSVFFKTGKIEGKLFRVSNPPEEKNGGRIETDKDKFAVSVVVERSVREVLPRTVEPIKNGRPNRPQKAIEGKVSDETESRYVLTFNLELEPGENRFHVKLPDSLGGEQSAEVVIVRKKRNPNVAVLAIGVPDPGLKFTTRDAKDFADAIVQLQQRNFFGNLSYFRLLNKPENTTRDSIAAAFEDLSKLEMDSFGYLFILISSHGRAYNNKPYLLPSNYSGKLTSCISYQEMVDDYISKVACRRFVFVDACHSGEGKSTASEWNDVPWQKNLPPNMVAFFSSEGSEESFEYKKGGHGIFTQAVLDAIHGVGVTDGRSYFTIEALDLFLKNRVREICNDPEETHELQNPKSWNSGLPKDLPVFGIIKK